MITLSLPADPGAMTLASFYEEIYRPACYKAKLHVARRQAIGNAVRALLEFSRPTITIAEITPELLAEFESSAPSRPPAVRLLRKMLIKIYPKKFPQPINRKQIQPEPVASAAAVAMPAHDLTLLSMFELLYLRDKHYRSESRAKKYRVTIKHLRWFLSREPKLSDLSPNKMPAFYSFLFRHGKAQQTIRDYVVCLQALLNYAAKNKLLDACPVLPSVVKTPQRIATVAQEKKPRPNTLLHFFEHTVWPTRLKDCKESTRKDYERAIREFVIFCDDPFVKVEEVTEQRIADFRKHLDARDKAPNYRGKGQGVAYQHYMRLRFILRCTEPNKFPKRHGHNRTVEPPEGPGGLRRFLQTYLSERDTSKGHRNMLRWVVNGFAKYLGREPEISDFHKDKVNGWLDSLLNSNVARITIQGRRTMLLTLWRAAHEVELIDEYPRRIKKIKVPRIIPKAWTHDEILLLLQQAMKVQGTFRRSGVSKRAFFTALILFGYDTGLRLIDMERVTHADIRAEQDGFGVVSIIQHKTGVPLAARLYPETMAAIQAICKEGEPRVFHAVTRKYILKQFRAIVKAVGLTGGTKMLRKTGATSVHAHNPGAAMGYLGHLTPSLGFRHYIDLAQAAASKPMPRRLFDVGALKSEPAALGYTPDAMPA